jgi:putative transposase
VTARRSPGSWPATGPGQFTDSSGAALASTGLQPVKTPPRSPRANAYAQRSVLTARTEATDQMLTFGQRHLRLTLAEYQPHDNRRRPTTADSPGRPAPTAPAAGLSQNRITRQPVLGGLPNEYQRAA